MNRYDFYDEDSGEPLLPDVEPQGRFVYFKDAAAEIHKLNNELTAVSLSRDNAIRDAQSHYGKYRDTLKQLNKLKGKS